MLRNNIDSNIITEKLIEAATARGKKNSLKYANRTVQKAMMNL